MKNLLTFELATYYKKLLFHCCLVVLLGFGFIIGRQFSILPSANIFKNSTYAITQMVGLLSLCSIFFTTLLATQALFREHDSRFSWILYSTPLNKKDYLFSRWAVVFIYSCVCLSCLVLGYSLGQFLSIGKNNYTVFNFLHYLNPLFFLGFINTFVCTAFVCSVAWLSQNKLWVYLTGLTIYVGYMVALVYSGSPLLAGATPPSAEAMDWAAKLDIFGLSAFYHQTINWSVNQRNTQLLSFTGNFLFNRLAVMSISLGILGVAVQQFSFREKSYPLSLSQNKIQTFWQTFSFLQKLQWLSQFNQFALPIYHKKVEILYSFIKLDLKFILKSIVFWLIALLLVFAVAMELYGDIDQGIRLPEHYASSGLITRSILRTFHGLCLIILLFYAHELVGRSRNVRFDTLENTTTVTPALRFWANYLSLVAIILLFSVLVFWVGLTFQWIYDYFHISLEAYMGIFIFNSLPLMLSAGVILLIHKLIPHNYIALCVACLTILLTATQLGKLIVPTHPLFLFQTAFGGEYSDFNGWGAYLPAFSCKMLFGFSFVFLLMITTASIFFYHKINKHEVFLFIFLLLIALFSGTYIYKNFHYENKESLLAIQQDYETQYRQFQKLAQPTVTKVQTEIDLQPQENSYEVKGVYTIQNKTNELINKILVNFDANFELYSAVLQIGKEKYIISKSVELINLRKALLPQDTAFFSFEMRYQWTGFNRHESFNAIIGNGTFIRISNYFPRFGYQAHREITDITERQARNLGKSTTSIVPLEAPSTAQNQLIDLEMIISTTPDQTAIGIGELIKVEQTPQRKYFTYQTPTPIPFRFGLSSAKYAVKKVLHQGKTIEVYYHPTHNENVAHLIRNAKNTLDYCQKNFSNYSFSTIRFAEISAFTRGFAATAYPSAIFMPENVVFHANIKGDKQQDVINELAGHELSHQWWGSLLIPDDREGAALLTETFAMYTELMLVKKMYGRQRLQEMVAMHESIYLKERGFDNEQGLYKTHSENTHQHYSKGAIVMYQLSEKIGEEKVNASLQTFLRKTLQSTTAPTSTDFITTLRTTTDSSLHSKIDEWFKEIVIYKTVLEKTTIHKEAGKYIVDFEAIIHKYKEDGKGNAQSSPCNETLMVAVETSSKKTVSQHFSVTKGKVKGRFNLPDKPQKVVLDADYMLLGIEKRSFEIK